MHHRRNLHFTSPEDSTFWHFLAYFQLFLCIKAVHNLKTKSYDIILTPCAISIIIGF